LSNVILLPHQIIGRDFLLSKRRAMLCDGVGLGKTIQAIAALQQECLRTIIFAPRPLLRQWSKEIRKFSCFLPTTVIGSRKQREALYQDKGIIYLINYDKAAIDINPILSHLKGRIDCIILDEAQRIKNYKTGRSKAIKQIANDLGIENRWILTATPIENNISELYSLLDFLDYGILEDVTERATPVHGGSYRGYTYERAGIAGPPKRKAFVSAIDNLERDQLYKMLEDIMLRRAEIGGMPPTIKDYYLDMGTVQARIYKGFSEEFEVYIDDQSFDLANALAKMTRLRQIANTPALIMPNYREVTPKVREILAIAEDMISFNEKVIFFSEFKKMTDLIHRELDKRYIKHAYMHGESNCNPDTEKDFFERPGVHILLSTKTGEEGLNLQFAHNVVNIELPYNPARITQRIGRCDRIGQTHQVQVINLITEGSIEEKIQMMIYEKENLFDDIINSHNTEVVLDRDTIRQLAHT